MDFNLADKAATIALKGMIAGEPVEQTFAEISRAVLPKLPESVRSAAGGLILSDDIDALTEQLRDVLASEPPPADVNGLWFGIAEMVWGAEDGAPPDENATPEFTLYVCGSTGFDPENGDWPCGPEWWPDARYFDLPSFNVLSDLCPTLDGDDAWLVATGLVEPLSILLVGHVCRTIEPGTLLGEAMWRGVGSGFDGGDYRDIGVMMRDGFSSPALFPAKKEPKPRKASATKKPARKKPTRKKQAQKKRTQRKPTAKSAKKATRKPAKKAAKQTARKATSKPAKKRAARKASKKTSRKSATTRASRRKTSAKKPARRTKKAASRRAR